MYVGGISKAEELCRVSFESLEAFTDLWHRSREGLRWTCPFVLPPWLNAWWSIFGADEHQPLLAVARQGEDVIGVAPLMVRGSTVAFLGDPEICDYFDFILVPGKEDLFFATLFWGLSEQGFKSFELGPLRSDSFSARFLSSFPFAGITREQSPEGVLFEMELPGSRDELLAVLSGKERHELRRKLRRLYGAGAIRFRRVDDAVEVPAAMETFFRLFTMNRAEKASFMTERMASFFRSLAFALAEDGMLRLFFLEVDEQPVASVFCFDHMGVRYLYNNGYDKAYSDLSVGLISKVLSLEAAIDDGLRYYNFLKGDEPYKRRLGGREALLTRFSATLS